MITSEHSLSILKKRYFIKDDKGEPIEDWAGLCRRVARNISLAEKKYSKKESEVMDIENKFYDMMYSLKFLPNSPTLMNAGTKLQMLSACFILDLKDSMESIFKTLTDAAMIFRSGGGCGYSFAKLRPNGAVVKSTNGTSSGSVSFMKVFNAMTEVVKQGGKRRGASLAVQDISHPDIEEFLTCKKDEGQLSNFNISVAITDDFMEKVKSGGEIELIHEGKTYKKVIANKLWDMLVHGAWQNGEPGVFFIDTVNKKNPVPHIDKIYSGNPCLEFVSIPNGSCNLGSINLTKFIKDNTIDYDTLKNIVHLSVRFLDDVIDMNRYPLKEIHDIANRIRPIGLGIMGFADMLIMLNIPYDSDQAIKIGSQLIEFIDLESKHASIDLAMERGSFPDYKESVVYELFKKRNTENWINLQNRMKRNGIRNSNTTLLAPTGTISLIANEVSSGIEPIFALEYERNDSFGIHKMKHWIYREYLESKKEYAKDLFKTANEIHYTRHIEMQAAFQKFLDGACSKTINMDNKATKEDVAKAFMLAYDSGCKGLTIYRNGSREEEVLTKKKDKKEHLVSHTRSRGDALNGKTYKLKVGCGTMYITLNSDDIGPAEIFLNLGKAGNCQDGFLQWGGRLMSLALRSGIPIEEVIKASKGISCPVPKMDKDGRIDSCADGIAKQIERHLGKTINVFGLTVDNTCPECGCRLERTGGCISCKNCGYSKCG